jgi:hypothetical protein
MESLFARMPLGATWRLSQPFDLEILIIAARFLSGRRIDKL